MYFLVLALSAALFLIFGLGYGASLADRLGVSLSHPFLNNRFNLGPINVRGQNRQFFTSNTSSSNSFIGDHERQRNVRPLDSEQASTGINRETPSQNALRDEANNSQNILGLPLDSFAKDVRNKELFSYGNFRQPDAAQSNYTGLTRSETNREIILRALQNTIQQNTESGEIMLKIGENPDAGVKSITDIRDPPDAKELARKIKQSMK